MSIRLPLVFCHAAEPTRGQTLLRISLLVLPVLVALTGGASVAAGQEPRKQAPGVHDHTGASHSSPPPVKTAPAPAPADEHSGHDTPTTPEAPADEHGGHGTTTAKEPADGNGRGVVIGGFAALNAAILLAAAGVRRRDPKRQRQARPAVDG